MADPTGRYHIVFNGEIYEHHALRDQLEALGHSFHTLTDTEVLLAAWAQWGPACLERLNGMFAFVVWDAEQQRLFAARDRFGVKPLYLWHGPGRLALASEIKQLLEVPGVRARLHPARAIDFLVSGLSDHVSTTLFAGVVALRGGECLSVRVVEGVAPHVRRWYEAPASGALALDEDEAVAELGARLDDAVRLRLRGDVPVGTCLSGGLDSSTLVCLVARRLAAQGAGPPATFSAYFDDPLVDEHRYAEAVVAATRSRAHVVRPSVQGVLGRLDQLLWHLDEPFGGTSVFAQWEVFALAAEHGVVVTLDGQGADELLGGYQHMLAAHEAALRQRRAAAALGTIWARPEPEPEPRRAGPTWPGFMAASARDAADDEQWAGRRREPGLGQTCRHMLLHQGLPILLRYDDRNSMAHGVESRVPFLDHRVAELAIGLGDRHKIFAGLTKYVLRRAMRGVVPAAVLQRRSKIGFSTPEAAWISGPLREALARLALRAAEEWPTLLDPRGVAALGEGSGPLPQPRALALWRVACFGAWARRFAVQGG